MTDTRMQAVLEIFPSTTWAKPTSKRYQDGLGTLSSFTDVEVVDALKSLRRNIIRAHVTADEIVGEIRRLRRRSELAAIPNRDYIDTHQVEAERADIRRLLLLASREDIAAGVAAARQLGVLSPEPLSPNVEAWTEYARGIVFAAMEKNGVFK
jgi:hypothetical protein